MTITTNKIAKNRYLLATIVVVFVTMLIKIFVFNELKEMEEKPNIEIKSNQVTPSHNKAFQIRLTNVSLPEPPPKTKVTTNKISHSQTAQNKQSDINVSSTSSIDAFSNSLVDIRPSAVTLVEKKFDVGSQIRDEQSYEQLVSLSGNERSLYFYENSENELAKTIDYMHRCVDIGLASYDGKDLTRLRTSGNLSQYSKIYREVSGFKSDFEQALINTYTPNQSLIRLYPKWFDMKLAKFISGYIQNQPLTQFSGAYLLTGKQLQLIDISINNVPIHDRWTILGNC